MLGDLEGLEVVGQVVLEGCAIEVELKGLKHRRLGLYETFVRLGPLLQIGRVDLFILHSNPHTRQSPHHKITLPNTPIPIQISIHIIDSHINSNPSQVKLLSNLQEMSHKSRPLFLVYFLAVFEKSAGDFVQILLCGDVGEDFLVVGEG